MFASFDDTKSHELLYQPVVGRPPICHVLSGTAGKEKQYNYFLLTVIVKEFINVDIFIFSLLSKGSFPMWVSNRCFWATGGPQKLFIWIMWQLALPEPLSVALSY